MLKDWIRESNDRNCFIIYVSFTYKSKMNKVYIQIKEEKDILNELE